MRICGDDPHHLLPAAVGIVQDFAGPSTSATERDDMLSDALFGAATALPRWRPDGGASPREFARHRMRGAILDGLQARRAHPTVSLDELAGENLEGPRRELADRAAGRPFSLVHARMVLIDLLGRLPEREREVVVRMDLCDHTAADVAADWGVTDFRVWQTRRAALAHMRDHAASPRPRGRPSRATNRSRHGR